jgi:hypothetical protein
LLLQIGQDLPRSVTGAVIHAEEFDRKADRKNPLNHGSQRPLFVVNGHYD